LHPLERLPGEPDRRLRRRRRGLPPLLEAQAARHGPRPRRHPPRHRRRLPRPAPAARRRAVQRQPDRGRRRGAEGSLGAPAHLGEHPEARRREAGRHRTRQPRGRRGRHDGRQALRPQRVPRHARGARLVRSRRLARDPRRALPDARADPSGRGRGLPPARRRAALRPLRRPRGPRARHRALSFPSHLDRVRRHHGDGDAGGRVDGRKRLAATARAALRGGRMIWAAPAAAFLISLAATPVVRRLALLCGATDVPDARRVHSRPTARAGGVGVALAAAAGLVLAGPTGHLGPLVFVGAGTAVHGGDVAAATAPLVLAAALLGFLPYNFNPATIFLGDSGSLVIGYALAVLPLAGTAGPIMTPLAALFLVAVPATDTSLAIARRFLSRCLRARGDGLFWEGLSDGLRNTARPDRRHVHHRLLDLGFNQRRAVLLLYMAATSTAALAYLVAGVPSWPVDVVALGIGVTVIWLVQALGFDELQPARSGLILPVLRRLARRRPLIVVVDLLLVVAAYGGSLALTGGHRMPAAAAAGA